MDDNKITDKQPIITEGKSGNKLIDDFIEETQQAINWIDFEKFKDLKLIGEEDFAKVYSAIWLDGGKIQSFTDSDGERGKLRMLPQTVALRSIKGSNEVSTEFINKLKIHYNVTLENGLFPFYGITKDSNNSEFMTVTGIADDGTTEGKSGNKLVDDFIEETQQNLLHTSRSIKWIDFEKFRVLKLIGEGGFAKVYLAFWLDRGKKELFTESDGLQVIRTLPKVVALKSIKGSNETSTEFLNELKIYYKVTLKNGSFTFYGITKDPNSSELMTVTDLADGGSLRSTLERRFTELTWEHKVHSLSFIATELKGLHDQEICHKDFHSGNILRSKGRYYVTDFGLSGPSNKSSNEIYGVLGYIAPEVLKGKPYCTPADIYSFGIIMTEFSTGFPPYLNKNMHETDLAISICNGLRPDFGKGTPEIYKSLAYKCMDANPEKRPTVNELVEKTTYWHNCLTGNIKDDDAKKIKVEFEIADKEIPNVQSSYKNNSEISNFKYVSKLINFSDVLKSSTTSIYNDSSLINLKLSDVIDENVEDDED